MASKGWNLVFFISFSIQTILISVPQPFQVVSSAQGGGGEEEMFLHEGQLRTGTSSFM